MALMQASQPLALLRQILSDMNSQGRWTNDTLLNFIDRANKRVVRDTLFPDSRLTKSTVIISAQNYFQQEYELPQVILIHRVYLAGQLCVPTDIDTLEGHQIGLYSQGPNNAAPLSGTGGPSGTSGPYSPDWVSQTPLSYPVSNSALGYPAPDAQPWFTGSRPRYYLRGGFLGFVPPPSNVATITVDCVRVPDTITAPGQDMTTPDMACDAIAWGAATYAQFADDQERNAAQRGVAEQNYQMFMKSLRGFRKMYEGDAPQGPKPRTYRSSWTRFRNRRN